MKNTDCMKLGITLAGVLALHVFPARVHASPPQYSVIDLGTVSTSLYDDGVSINASGQVVGTALPSTLAAVRWTGTTAEILASLGPAGISQSQAKGINGSGQVAGFSSIPDALATHEVAVRWTGTTVQALGWFDGLPSNGWDINASGQVAGFGYIPDGVGGPGPIHAVRWTGTTPQQLGNLGDYSSLGYGYGINDSGQVAGSSTIGNMNGPSHAVRWTGTTPQDLGTLGGTLSWGFGINGSGQVSGWSHTAGDAAQHAVRWTGTTLTDLGTLGGSYSVGLGINAAGDVIGYSTYDDNEDAVSFLYTGGTMYNLSDLILPGSGFIIIEAGKSHGINDLGQIAASGFNLNGERRALLLTPVAVPEPASALLLLGSAGLWLGGRRRRPGL